MATMSTKSEDQELILQFFTSRDPALREKIVLRYIPLVHYVLGRLGLSSASTPDYDDAVSQGLLGLLDAIDRYNPSHGAQFSTYAILKVRGSVLDYLRSQDWLSRTARRRTRDVQKAANELWQQFGRMPSNEELSERLGMSLSDLQNALVDASAVMVSLDGMGESDDEEETTLHEVLADGNQPDPAATFDEQELEVNLLSAIKNLPEREQMVLSLYYYNELTLKEIGEVLQVSESRVCQLHARAVMSLRAGLAQGNAPARDQDYAPPAARNYPASRAYDYEVRR